MSAVKRPPVTRSNQRRRDCDGTPGDISGHSQRRRKSNPIADSDAAAAAELTARQLAAARLLATGRKPSDVAAELGITRMGLWKWRRLPGFATELRRLHDRLAAATVAAAIAARRAAAGR